MKVLLTGGGTAGSVSPLLAVSQQLKKDTPSAEFLWLGAKGGPERKMVADYGIDFRSIASGKLRRYFDIRNFFDVFKIKIGFFQSIFIILKFNPDIILSAGSFVSVPVVWAGWILGKKSLIHQQDMRPGLANKLMAPFATKITVTFKESLKHFPKDKTVWTGNPAREEILRGNNSKAINKFKLEQGLPTLLVMGGGTGSVAINTLVMETLDKLVEFCQIIHVTGGKVQASNNSSIKHLRCHQVDFLDVKEMADVYAIADVVVSRCGMSSLTELSVLGKPTIFIPLENTHQEDNAKLILEKGAGIVLWKKDLALDEFIKTVKDIISNKNEQTALSKNISNILINGSIEKIIQIIRNI